MNGLPEIEVPQEASIGDLLHGMTSPQSESPTFKPAPGVQSVYSLEKENDITSIDFHKKKRHVIVMTEAGKPVYTRYGDEAELSPVVATLNVIVNKLRAIRGSDNLLPLRRIETNVNKTLVFSKYGLFSVVITKDKNDHDLVLSRLSDAIFHQILCSITNSFVERLEKNPSLNPGQNLESYHPVMAWTFGAGLNSYSVLFNAFMAFPLNISSRKKIKETMGLFKAEGIIFKMLVTQQNVICMENDEYSLTAEDINALFHLIHAQCRTPNVDYWIPVCLPSIAPEGYLNMYYRNLEGAMGVLLLSSSGDNIADAVQMCQKIEISLAEEKATEMIKKYSKLLPLEPKAFGFTNICQMVVYQPAKQQFHMWGLHVYSRLTPPQRVFMNQVAAMYELYLKSDGKKFAYVEKIEDYFIGAVFEQGLLIFIKQLPWFTKDDLQNAFKRVSMIVKNDLNNFFL